MSLPLINPVAFAKILKRRNASRIIQLYLEEAGMAVHDLRAAVSNHDAQSLMQAAHKLKGSSSYVGASAVQALSAALEDLGRAAVLGDHAPLLLLALEREFERTQHTLEEALD